tara:strand:- start:313 stop:705 length:393 start_codon:yes stop_codon:yes gene_type:complete
MRHRRIRRFRHRSNPGRTQQMRKNGMSQIGLGSNSFVNDRNRNNFKNRQSAEKLIERYNALAKEALSSGDRVLSENYLQHVDHFMRIIEERNLNQEQNKINDSSKSSNSPHIDKEKELVDKNLEVVEKKV